MASKVKTPLVPVVKRAKAHCSVSGCTKQVQSRGMCKRHRSLALLDAGVDPAEKVVVPVEKVTAASAVAGGAAVELTVLFDATLTAWLEDLAGATTERSRSRMFVSMCEAIEGLGY